MDIYWGYEVKFDPGYIFRCKRDHANFHFKKILKYSPQIPLFEKRIRIKE